MWFLIVTLFPNVGPLGVLTGHAVSILLYSFLLLKFKVKFPAYYKYLIIGAIFFSATIVMSHLANYDQTEFSLSQMRYALVPFYWLMGLLAGTIDAKVFGGRRRNWFYTIAAIFITVQIPLVFLQVLGYDSLIWTAEKARDWTGILRVVGTVQNPNTLGILTILCIVIFSYSHKEKPFWSKVFIVVGVLIIFATGSRTSLIILLFLPLIFISKEKLFSKGFVKTLVVVFLGLLIFYFLLVALRDALPYMSQLLNLVEGQSVHTLDTRFAHWESIHQQFISSPIKNKLFGFGPGYFTVLDNSYFYVLYNYGIMACVSFLVVIFLLFQTFKKTDGEIAQKGLLILLICGLVADALMNFLFMTVIYYLIGLQSYSDLRYLYKEV